MAESQTPSPSPFESLVYSWAIAVRRMILPALVSIILVWLGKAGFAGESAQQVAELTGEAIVLLVTLAAHRLDWAKYVRNIEEGN